MQGGTENFGCDTAGSNSHCGEEESNGRVSMVTSPGSSNGDDHLSENGSNVDAERVASKVSFATEAPPKTPTEKFLYFSGDFR